MQYLAYAAAATFVLYALGLGYTLLLLPRDRQHYAVIVAPWVGYCYASLICWHVCYLGGKIDSFTVKWIFLPSLISLGVALFTQGIRSVFAAVFCRNTGGALVVAAAAFVVLSIPAFWDTTALTTVSLFDYDTAQYASFSRFYSEFTRGSTVGFVGQNIHYFDSFLIGGYFGPTAFAAFAGASLGVMAHQDTTLCINLFAAFGAAALFLILHDTLKFSAKVAWLGIALFGFHPALQYLVLQGFFGQIVGIGLAVMMFWVNALLVEPRATLRDQVCRLILLSCFTFGLLLTYQQMLLFVWALSGIYSAHFALLRKDARPLAKCVIWHLCAFAISGLVCYPRALELFSFVQHAVTAQAGWFLPFYSPDYLAGVSYQNAPFTITNPHLHTVLAIVICAFASFLFAVTYPNAKRPIPTLWLCCGIFYVGCILLAFKGSENGQMGGYKSFKIITFFLPLFVAAVTSLLGIQPAFWKNLSKVVKIAALTGLVSGYYLCHTRLLDALRSNGKRVEAQYQDLLTVDSDQNIESVNILGGDGWEIMWAAYFLMHKNLSMESRSYYRAGPLQGKYDLQDRRGNAPIRHLPSGRVPPFRHLNDRFTLLGPFTQ